MALDWPPDDRQHATETPDPMVPVTSSAGSAESQNSQGSPILNSQPASSTGTGPQLVTQGSPQPPSSMAIWIDRIALVIRVVFYIELGMLLAVLPWTRLWTDNGLVSSMPNLRQVLQLNFVRGLVTGIGLVDVWIGIWEAVRYRENKSR
jgi:hypothetical protein